MALGRKNKFEILHIGRFRSDFSILTFSMIGGAPSGLYRKVHMAFCVRDICPSQCSGTDRRD